MNKRISTTTGIIVIVVLALIVIGGVFAYQYYWLENKEENATEEIDISDWETYRNEEYGYEIKYPTDAQLTINDNYDFSGGCVYIEYNKETIAFTGDLRLATKTICAGFTGRGVDNIRLADQELSIGGRGYYFSAETNETNEYLSLVGSLSEGLSFYYWGDSEPKDTPVEISTVMRSILSTFKFIEKTEKPIDETANWKTYTNKDYSFEIKYPEKFVAEENLFSTNFSLIFCPPNLIETRPDNSVGCKIKSVLKGSYEGGIYLFTYDNNDILNKDEYYYLGQSPLDNKYYYMFIHDNLSQYKNITEEMISTFKFID